MAVSDNLLSASQNFFAPEIVQKMSDLIGQSANKTKEGLYSVIPTLMSAIIDKGTTPEGAASLIDMVNTHNFESTTKPDESKLNEGNDVVKNIFGNNLNNVVTKLGSTTGLSGSSITKILGLAAPIFMGVLGSKVKNEKLNSSGVMNFLSQQKNALPKSAMQSKYLSQEISWPKIALAALVLLGLWFWWQASLQKDTTPTIRSEAPLQTTEIRMINPSINELSAFMAAGAVGELPKHFRFEKLSFATGSTRLLSGAEEELEKIADAMIEFPLSTARIEGFTDNAGNEELNKDLSAKRAESVKAELVARGIDENRIQTVGMGSEKPIGDNATEEGRAENRRIEFVITKIK